MNFFDALLKTSPLVKAAYGGSDIGVAWDRFDPWYWQDRSGSGDSNFPHRDLDAVTGALQRAAANAKAKGVQLTVSNQRYDEGIPPEEFAAKMRELYSGKKKLPYDVPGAMYPYFYLMQQPDTRGLLAKLFRRPAPDLPDNYNDIIYDAIYPPDAAAPGSIAKQAAGGLFNYRPSAPVPQFNPMSLDVRMPPIKPLPAAPSPDVAGLAAAMPQQPMRMPAPKPTAMKGPSFSAPKATPSKGVAGFSSGRQKAAEAETAKNDKKDPKSKLGPWQHANVADAVGATSIERAARKREKMDLDQWDDWLSRMLIGAAPLDATIMERVRRANSRLSENSKLRWASKFDPTANNQGLGVVSMLAGINAGKPSELAAMEQLVAQRYANKLKKYQDPVIDSDGPVTERETPWHVAMQGMLANLDSDVAGQKYMRKERPGHYWLNPFASAGPLREIMTRLRRRDVAGMARPDSTGGRFTMGLLPPIAMLAGTGEAQQQLRRAAIKNDIYAPEATPQVVDPEAE